jgi:hypothetical protein
VKGKRHRKVPFFLLPLPLLSRAGSLPQVSGTPLIPVGAAEGCDLLILIFKMKIKRPQPSAAPTGGDVNITVCISIRDV